MGRRHGSIQSMNQMAHQLHLYTLGPPRLDLEGSAYVPPAEQLKPTSTRLLTRLLKQLMTMGSSLLMKAMGNQSSNVWRAMSSLMPEGTWKWQSKGSGKQKVKPPWFYREINTTRRRTKEPRPGIEVTVLSWIMVTTKRRRRKGCWRR